MQQAMQTLRNRAFGKRTSKPDSSPENTKDPYLDTRRKRTAIIYDWLKSQNVTWPTTITGFVVCTLLIWLNIPSKPFSLPTDQRLTLEPTASHNTSYDQFAVLLSDTRRPAYSAYRQGNSAYKASLQGVNKVLIVSDTPFPSVEGQSVMQRTHAHLYNFMQGARDILNSFPETKWFVYMDPDNYVFFGNLLAHVDTKDASQPLIIHNFNETEGFLHGRQYLLSSMAVISRAAMQKILDERITMSACMKASNQKLAIEEILMACTSTLGVPEERNPNIHRDDPGIGSDWLMDPCRWPLSVNRVHHITMMLLCPSAGSKCIVHDTYATLFHRVFFPNTYNTIRESPLDAKSNDTTLGACISSCSNFPACKSWSFDSKNGCFINKDIPRSKWHHGGRSGVCSERYACGLTRDSKDHCTQNQPAFWRKRDNRTEAANAITRIVKRKTRMGGRFPFF